MRAIGQQVDVVQGFFTRFPWLVAHFQTAQPLHPRHALHTRHDQPQRIAILGTQHFAIHGPSDNHIVQRAFHTNGARQPGTLCALGQHIAAFGDISAAVFKQPGQWHAGEFATRQHAVGVLHGGNRHIAPFHAGVGAAFDKVDTRHRRQAHQIIHGVHARFTHQAIDHQPMLTRIDIPPPLVMALEMQAAGRDNAEQSLQRRKSDRRLRDACEPRTLAALQILFIFSRQPVAQCRHRLTQARRVRWQLQYGGIALRVRWPRRSDTRNRSHGTTRQRQRLPKKPATRFGCRLHAPGTYFAN